jgi:hypothetical protein
MGIGEPAASSLGRVGEVHDARVPTMRKVTVATTRTEPISGVGYPLFTIGDLAGENGHNMKRGNCMEVMTQTRVIRESGHNMKRGKCIEVMTQKPVAIP